MSSTFLCWVVRVLATSSNGYVMSYSPFSCLCMQKACSNINKSPPQQKAYIGDIFNMEESSELQLGRVSFALQHPLPSFTKGRLEKMDHSKVHEHLTYKEKTSYSSCYHPSEVPKSPMEFLSRSWSPSASDFFHILSSNSLLLHLDGNCEIEEDGERLEIEGTKGGTAQYKKNTVKRVGNIWSYLTTGRSVMWVLQRHRALKNNWMNMGDMKELLRGRSLTSFSRRCREKKKEEVRLQTAKLHAALSIAQLAAAIAGLAAKGGLKSQDINNNMASDGGSWDKKMGVAVASATALVATVCAEAAESVGAPRAHVASVINSGLATQTSTDMITLTAAAATCLRGAETLNSRAMADICFSKEQQMLARGAKLSIHTSSGQIQFRMVCIYLKHNKPILRLGKKYFGGILTTSKEYKIINVMEETKEDQGFHSLALGTNIGNIKLLFKDGNQSNIWLSTISHLLLNHNSYPITNTQKHVTV